MKKIIKTLILLPMWPLILLQMPLDEEDCGCAFDLGCKERARKMVAWWKK